MNSTRVFSSAPTPDRRSNAQMKPTTTIQRVTISTNDCSAKPRPGRVSNGATSRKSAAPANASTATKKYGPDSGKPAMSRQMINVATDTDGYNNDLTTNTGEGSDALNAAERLSNWEWLITIRRST